VSAEEERESERERERKWSKILNERNENVWHATCFLINTPIKRNNNVHHYKCFVIRYINYYSCSITMSLIAYGAILHCSGTEASSLKFLKSDLYSKFRIAETKFVSLISIRAPRTSRSLISYDPPPMVVHATQKLVCSLKVKKVQIRIIFTDQILLSSPDTSTSSRQSFYIKWPPCLSTSRAYIILL